MITPKNMLVCVAAHLLAGKSKAMHITDRQLWAACETQTSLEVWATQNGLAASPGEFNGYAGWWLSVEKGGEE